jgi:hypothetical protein
MNNRQERREQWSRTVALQEKSGQSVREFCQERRLTEASFYAWRQRMRKEKPVRFALVDTTNSPSADGVIELVLTSGDRIRIPRDAGMLRLVLSVLRERS